MKKLLLSYYAKTKRDLPWRKTSDPYKIWVSEIFLQQTQVSRVIDFYEKFLEKFPTIHDLSQSSWEEFVPYFQGLGFYSRGRNMLKTAYIIETEFFGKFPENKSDLIKLPGIGEYTASAILSFAYQQNFPAFDVNLYRVLGRFFGYKDSEIKQKTNKNYKQVLQDIEKKSEELFYTEISGKNSADLLNHAFMDLGSSVCTAKKAECTNCPLKKKCKTAPVGGVIFHIPKYPNQKEVSPSLNNKNLSKTSVMVLHHEKKYFLISEENPKNSKNILWKFPEFSHNEEREKHTKQLNHRHFLQEKSLLHLGIEISVRPPFKKEIITENTAENLYIFSRCQILQGDFFSDIVSPKNKTQKISGKFFTKTEISALREQKKIPEKFSGIFEEILKMRF